MAETSGDPLREAAPQYADVEARRARAGVAAALFGDPGDEGEPEPILVGRYRVESRLGAGGMGVVYRAHDPDLDRPVAVKLLHNDAADDDKARGRMLREARSLAKLSHPNVITVYDVGLEDEQVFVAMELVAGEDLRHFVAGREIEDWQAILEVFIAAGRGLEAAHAVGLVHRDFKPENVLVGNDGRVRVLDFGLARARKQVAADPAALDPAHTPRPTVERDRGDDGLAHLPTAALTGHLTETGALLGTPLYMAPEIYAGKPATAASDQFAFCASLYEGLYRRRPFGEDTLTAHMDAVQSGRAIAPTKDSPVPAPVWEAISRGLAAQPSDRHADVAGLLAVLEDVIVEYGVGSQSRSATSARTSGQRQREGARDAPAWRLPAIVVGVVLLAGTLVAAELGLFTEDGPPRAAATTMTGVGDTATGADSPDDVGEVSEVGEVGDGRVRAPADSETDTAGDLVEPNAETGVEPDAETGDETGDETANETDSGEVHPPNGSNGPELRDWCHLHEDRYTLLARTARKHEVLRQDGACYACRVERRKGRTRNFSPRDCAGYLLCGPSDPEACE